LDGVIDRRVGAEGKEYGIGFAVALPDNWNGRFLMQGGGGLNGTVRNPLGDQATGGNPGLARGFAVVTTDTGHKSSGGAFDSSFMRDQQAVLDFSYVAVGRVAPIAKQIVSQYYGRGADRSYFVGCSTGGREAMLMAERYPSYFDGIVAGSPAMRTGFSGIGDRWVAITLNQIAPKDAAGKPIPAGIFSDAEKKTIINGIMNSCDEKDGVKDGMIFNTQACNFDPATLVCKGAKTDSCLSSDQTSAIKRAFVGPKDSRGVQVYPGFAFDTGITASGGGIPGLLSPGPGPLGPANTSIEQNVDREAANAASDPRGVGDTANWTNLNSFSSHGGKLLFFHGVSDPWFSALDTVDYYQRMSKDNGGMDKVMDWSRLFLVPGMGHCQGGQAALDSFDMLGAVLNWVEKASAPDSVTATGRAFPGRSRPLCPYPQHTHYKGQGDPEDAKNFECRN
jgi:feruloyl esterase